MPYTACTSLCQYVRLEKWSAPCNCGINLLIEEFGKDYAIYFSILELIAAGKTSRLEIESVLQIQAGAYLARLETDYAVLSRVKLNRARIDLALLKVKAEKLLSSYPGYHVEWLALGLEDIGSYVR